jgi:hypothetical protein
MKNLKVYDENDYEMIQDMYEGYIYGEHRKCKYNIERFNNDSNADIINNLEDVIYFDEDYLFGTTEEDIYEILE